ncbi:MAG: hypothetical protein M0P29_10235 [Sphaerochaetaceae bacterium]|jgi:polyferredoxin|nr:hypothetical protein [Sphaerochaetaceae bacterium]
MQNITITGDTLHFGRNCAMCMHCAMFCPEDAMHMGIIHFWKINSPYRFHNLLHDTPLKFPFVDENTKGYFRLFLPYYKRVDAELARLTACDPCVTIDDDKGDQEL